MANSDLFDYKNVKVNTSRSGFDGSGKRAFTSKPGELNAIWWTMLNPGDTVQGQIQHFTRTRPVETSAFTRFREYFDVYAVPCDLLWKSFPTAVTLMQENSLQAISMSENLKVTDEMPYLTLKDLVSFDNGQSVSAVKCISTGSQSKFNTYLNDVSKHAVNYFGFSRAALMLKHLSYMRYCRIYDDMFNQSFIDWINGGSNRDVIKWSFPVNIFPILAYQKIYNDFFRLSQWEEANPFNWNVDYSSGGQLSLPSVVSYWQNNTMFDMRYANWNKDLFMGMLPESQYGDVASLNIEFNLGSIPVTLDVTGTANFANGQLQGRVSSSDGTAPTFRRVGLAPDKVGASGNDAVFGLTADGASSAANDVASNLQVTGSINVSNLVASGAIDASKFTASYSILALRMQEALQKWKEVAQCGNQDYRDQVYRQFGVTLPDELSQLAEWVAGSATNLNIDEVVNNNLSGSNSADIKGKGVGFGQGSFSYTAKRHCVLMCIYHVVPLLDYDISGIGLQNLWTSAYDYPIPAFDRIGFEELNLAAFTNAGYRITGYNEDGTPNYYSSELPDEPVTMGYVPRYISAKTDIDVVLGDFCVSQKNWVAPISDEYLFENIRDQAYQVNYNFFKVNPHIVDTIFGIEADSSVKTDQFLVNSYFDVKMVKNLDYNGLPY